MKRPLVHYATAFLAVAGLAAPLAAAASKDAATPERVTFYRDVLPILQNNCQDCHRAAGYTNSGMVAPMSLTSYEEARPWAKSIARVVESKEMPPWYAAEEFSGVFELERHLTAVEIATLVKWSRTGAPRGNPAEAPKPKDFSSGEGWVMGEPDIVIKMAERYWVADDIEDIQPRFEVVLTEEQLPEDRWIHWIEFRPGNPKLVHHGGARVTVLDGGGNPVEDPVSGGKIIGTAPGDGPDVWPPGYGKLIRKGSRISFGLHYHKEPGPGTGGWDQSMIAIKWHTEPVKHVVRAAGISSRGWEIPPHTKDWQVGAARTFEEDSYIINMMPHMHTRGQAAKYELVYPNESRETILDVPRYDYNWQLTYTFKQPKFAPAGSRLEVTMWFDNTLENPNIYDDAGRPVAFGGMTTDEMNIGWTEYANAAPIEDISSHDFGTKGTGVEDIDDIDDIE